MATPGMNGREVVNIASDSDEDAFSDDDDVQFFDANHERQGPLSDFPRMDGMLDYNRVCETPNGIIDLTAIPDIDVPPSDPLLTNMEVPDSEGFNGDSELVTEAVGLQMVLDFLPDIAIDHVLNIIRERTTDLTRTMGKCQEIVVQLVEEGTYPKEEDEANNRKRKRNDEDDWKHYDTADRDPDITTYEVDAANLLKDEFLNVPVRHITNILNQHKTLFKAYIVLNDQVRNYGHITNNLFSRIGKARPKRGVELLLIEEGSQIPKELHAVKKKLESDMAKRRKAEENEQAEMLNLQHAQSNGQMGECACCFDDVPLNRMISCNGDTTHSYCLECPKRQIETQMGLSNCRPKCFGVDDCDGMFARKDLQQVLGDTTFERLEHLQQQQDLAAAGLDFLSECPFCDFKMECPPVEVDKEFRCQNKKCGKTSCRLCEKETHIPLTCKEADKDGQITLRHIVEEAMSAALIRQCNRCKHPFVKEHGCNKMTCSHCRNVQCYVCSKDVNNYEHFGEVGRGRCPLHENVEDRHEQEVKKAADEAMAKVRADNPGVSDSDLMIKVSDRVKQAEDARKGRGQAQANVFPYHMVDNQIQHRMPRPPPEGQPPDLDHHVVRQRIQAIPQMPVPAARPGGFDFNFLQHNQGFGGNGLGQPQAPIQPHQQLQPQPQPHQQPYRQQQPYQQQQQQQQPYQQIQQLQQPYQQLQQQPYQQLQQQPHQQLQQQPYQQLQQQRGHPLLPPGNPAVTFLQARQQDGIVPFNVGNLNQRLDGIPRWQQVQAQLQIQRRMRLLRLQQGNADQQGEVVQQGEGPLGERQDEMHGGLGLARVRDMMTRQHMGNQQQ